jgi:integrase
VTPRAFRKAVATLVAEALGSRAAQDQLGHSSDAVTRKHYIEKTHEGPDVAELLDREFGKP